LGFSLGGGDGLKLKAAMVFSRGEKEQNLCGLCGCVPCGARCSLGEC